MTTFFWIVNSTAGFSGSDAFSGCGFSGSGALKKEKKGREERGKNI